MEEQPSVIYSNEVNEPCKGKPFPYEDKAQKFHNTYDQVVRFSTRKHSFYRPRRPVLLPEHGHGHERALQYKKENEACKYT